MWINSARRQSKPALAYLVIKQRANLVTIEITLNIMPYATVSKQIRKVIPQAQFGIVAVGPLETFNASERFRIFNSVHEGCEAGLQRFCVDLLVTNNRGLLFIASRNCKEQDSTKNKLLLRCFH